MNDQPAQPAPRRKRRWPWIVLGVFLVLVVAYAAYRYTLHRMVEAKLDAIRKQGYPVTLAELDNWYKQPPPGENAADTIKNALAHRPSWTTNKLSKLPSMGGAGLPARNEALSVQMKQSIEDYLVESADAVAALHRASGIRSARFQVRFDRSFDMSKPTPASIQMLHAIGLLDLDALLSAETGQTAKAAGSLSAAMKLGHLLAIEPLPTSQLARMACEEASMRTLERMLSRLQFPEAMLMDIGAEFAIAEGRDGENWARAFAGQRCMQSEAYGMSGEKLGQMIMSSSEINAMYGAPASPNASLFGFRMIFMAYRLGGLLDVDHLRYLAMQERYIRCFTSPLPARLGISNSIATEVTSLSQPSVFAKFFLMAQEGYIEKEATHAARLKAAQVALAVERYRLARSGLPSALDELVPNITHSIPTDPFNNKPLRFKRLPQGYIIYSVGENEVDDGGDGYHWDQSRLVRGTDITFTVER